MRTRAWALWACFLFVATVGCGDDPSIVPAAETCTPLHCEEVGAVCGSIDDGCGETIECGTCTDGDVCIDGTCVGETCAPLRCEDVGAVCGSIDDGCGGTLECGTCTDGDVCVDGTCVGETCEPRTCEETGAVCGSIDDGCGETIECGSCTDGEECVDGTCVGETCTPLRCEDVGAVCGSIDNGCGETIVCGTCMDGDVCVDGTCVGETCTPLRCEDVGAVCGSINDGCGDTIECGTCTGSDVCVGGTCVEICTPRTCAELGAVCGTIDDGCGKTIDCGGCGIDLPAGWSWAWPHPTGSGLTAVWSFGDDDTWAVGHHGTILHWDGVSLDRIPSGTLADLLGLWASGPDDLWAIGTGGTLLHFDGTTWSFREVPTGADLVALTGTGPGDVWILGGGSLIRCGGETCSAAPAPLAPPLVGLASSPTLGVWLLGSDGALASWNGSGWTTPPAGTGMDLSHLAVGEAIWARNGTSVVRWQDGGWVAEPTAPWASWNQPVRLHAAATGGLWVLTPEGTTGNGLFHLQGGMWTRHTTGQHEGTSLHLSTESLWIAGARGQLSHLPLPATEPVLLTELPLYCQDLASVPSSQEVHWARCGVDVLRIEGDTIEILPRPELLRNETAGRGIWSQHPDEVWLITNRYRVHRWKDGSWATFSNFGGRTLNAMAGSGEDFFVFGEKGLVWKWLGDGFSDAIPTPTTLNLLAAWASGPNDVWAAGGSGLEGVIVHWNGTGWEVFSQPKLNWIHGASRDDVWAVGDGGLALHWNGERWSQVPTGTTSALRKVWAHGSGDVFVVPGSDGASTVRFLHHDGASFRQGPAPIHAPQAVSVTPSGRMISAGDGILLGD